jgi:pyruvate carboxylase
VISYLLYPKVYEEFLRHRSGYSDTSVVSTPVFFYGMETGEETNIEIEEGKTLIVKYITTGLPHEDGSRTVFFELNGQPRDVTIVDRTIESAIAKNTKADPADGKQVGAGMPGMVVTVAVKAGDTVEKGQKLLSLEAMKMETTIVADRNGMVKDVFVKPGTRIETGDLLLTFE